ncbi:MAG: hypothetical protein AAB263_18695, partial [Planctomycetota bacterium]
MIRGLRASDAVDMRRRTGGDMRLLLRMGSLLEAKRSLTSLALDRLLADDNGKKLLADRRLNEADPTTFTDIAAAHGVDDVTMLDAAHGADEGWLVIALADEVGNPLTASLATADHEVSPAGSLPALVGTLSPALREPVEGLLQARADDQRAAALERLRYAAPPLAVVGELMPMLLSDSAELVRERAIALIGAAGGHPLVIDLVRAMQRRDDATMLRLAPNLIGLSQEQQELAMSAAIAQASRGETTQGLIEVCAALPNILAGHRQLERLLDTLLPTSFSLIELIRRLQQVDPERMRTLLMRSMGFGAEQDARIIVLIAAPGTVGDPALLARGIDLVLESGEAPRNRMPLAAALRRLDTTHTLAALIAKHGARLGQAHDTAVHWLLAELCRDGAITQETGDELAAILRQLLREAPGPHLLG